MHIVLLGSTGQVGWELQRSLAPLGQLTALHRHSTPAGDLADVAGLAATLRGLRPDVIVNAAAYTAVDRAETDQAAAALINAEAVGVMAQVAEELGAWLVHYSTDYVFDGSGDAPWQEGDAPAPLNVYGKTKLAGEQAIVAACSRHLIFRTSWVYGTRGANFLKTMLRLGQEKSQLAVIADQCGAPTGAELLADVTAQIVAQVGLQPQTAQAKAGIYHLVASGETTWHGYASFIFATARELGQTLAVAEVKAVPTTAFPTPAQRPLNSRLSNVAIQRAFQVVLPDWRVGVTRVLREILNP